MAAYGFGERAVFGGIDHVDAGSQDRQRPSPRFQRALVGGPVDAAGEAAHHGEPLFGELVRQVGREFPVLPAGPPGAHHRHRRPGLQPRAGPRVEDRRRREAPPEVDGKVPLQPSDDGNPRSAALRISVRAFSISSPVRGARAAARADGGHSGTTGAPPVALANRYRSLSLALEAFRWRKAAACRGPLPALMFKATSRRRSRSRLAGPPVSCTPHPAPLLITRADRRHTHCHFIPERRRDASFLRDVTCIPFAVERMQPEGRRRRRAWEERAAVFWVWRGAESAAHAAVAGGRGRAGSRRVAAGLPRCARWSWHRRTPWCFQWAPSCSKPPPSSGRLEVRVEPPVPFTYQVSGRSILLRPSDPLRPGGTYAVEVEATDTAGRSIGRCCRSGSNLSPTPFGCTSSWTRYRTGSTSTGATSWFVPWWLRGGRPGFETPEGVFRIQNRGYHFFSQKYQEGAYYWVRIIGNYLFHSVPVDAEGNVIEEEAKKLGLPRLPRLRPPEFSRRQMALRPCARRQRGWSSTGRDRG